MRSRCFLPYRYTKAMIIGSILLLCSSLAAANDNIIWSGSFETGDILQWHHPEVHSAPWIWGIPEYCRPKEFDGIFGGDGSCLSLDNEIVRHGEYSAKFTVKNSVNGSEPEDCDGSWCSRRRAYLSNFATLSEVYDALPYKAERWISFSVYIPEDWAPAPAGWGPVIFDMKPYTNVEKNSGIANIHIEDGSWKIIHRWSDVKNPTSDDVPWQYSMNYRSDYPIRGQSPEWDDGVEDFPNPDKSRQALGSINKGGWTDWVLHIKYDARGSQEGGEGFLRYYKREDNGPWIQIVDIQPRIIERGGMTFDRGIGYNVPPTGGNNGGYGIGIGLYMDKDAAWNAPNNLTVNLDNIRIGDKNASLSEMAPNGTSRAEQSAPSSPHGLVVR